MSAPCTSPSSLHSFLLKRAVHCLAGTRGAEIVDELDVHDSDLVVPKRRYSAFFATDLDLLLRERDIDTVVVAGVVTNICVRSTVHDALFLGYDVLVCSDDAPAREAVVGLVGDLGLRGLDAGVLKNAIALEALTPVLLHFNKRYGSAGAGIRITRVKQKCEKIWIIATLDAVLSNHLVN